MNYDIIDLDYVISIPIIGNIVYEIIEMIFTEHRLHNEIIVHRLHNDIIVSIPIIGNIIYDITEMISTMIS